MSRLARIFQKLNTLRKLDRNFQAFGAYKHRYVLNQPLHKSVLQAFENKYQVKLPEEYVKFITQLGNGGAGPYYGLEPFQKALYNDLDAEEPVVLLDPSKAFPHTTPWNQSFTPSADIDKEEALYESQLADFDDFYFDPAHITGTIAICNFGCGVSIHLVIKGAEYGNIWMDDRGSEAGIFPYPAPEVIERLNFGEWYEQWLDNTLEELDSKKDH